VAQHINFNVFGRLADKTGSQKLVQVAGGRADANTHFFATDGHTNRWM
jgi:hypothetical protein